MSFEAVRKHVKRAPVLAGMDRMQPEMRTIATELLQRFADGRAAPMAIAHEGAALALWGTDKSIADFLAWHREVGGLARALEVLLAAMTFERKTYEWDDSIFALRRARPADGFGNLGVEPWLWMRDAMDRAKPAERAAAREIAAAASRAWLVRAALAFVFPDDKARWSASDETELRHADVWGVTADLGVLVAMRGEKLDHAKILKAWKLTDAITPAQVVKALGDAAVAPLRLLHAYPELAQHPSADALRALAEFADEDAAWEALAGVLPGKDSIAALAPMFTRLRPRRTLGLALARALLDEHVVAAPREAEALARGKSEDAALIARVIAETGATLPADDTWESPWATAPAAQRKPAATPRAPQPSGKVTEKTHGKQRETIHWNKGQQAALAKEGADMRGKEDTARSKECLKEAKTGQVLMLDLSWLSDAVALKTWKAIEPKKWYGQVDDVQQLLARFGTAELDLVLAFLRAKPEALAALANVESPRVAPLMARGYALLKKHQATGKAWLDRFPEAAASGLLGSAPDADKKQREANEKALAYLAKHHGKLVDAAIARTGGSAKGVTAAELVAGDTPKLPARKPKLPDFVQHARLPRPIRSDGKAALAGAALEEFVGLLKVTLPEAPASLDAIAARYTPASLARFAWALFRQWLFVKGPPKEKWALYAVGRFPADDHARALGRLARDWAPSGNPARAQEAVEVLGKMRTQTALVEIYDISRKVQSKALKARAEVVFETVAAELGLSKDELADRLVPELSEEDLTFGDQRVELDAKLEPTLATPPAKDSDDAKRFKELQKLCRGVARGQLARLEQAMADGYRMPFDHFAEIYQMHTLIRHLSRGLLWGRYEDDKLVAAFALADDGPVDVRGRAVTLPLDARYGVVHPAELSDAEREAWSKRIPSQPFPQLAREVFAASSAADVQKKLAKLVNRTVQTSELLGLQRRGWRRGDSPQGGVYYSMHRDGAGWTAELVFNPGIYLGSPTEQPTQILDAIVFRADGIAPASILSDIQRDLAQLATRAP